MQLVLDLSAVNFFGTQGFAARTISRRELRTKRHGLDDRRGRDARRLMRICDLDETLPLADRLESALARLDHIARRHNPIPFGGSGETWTSDKQELQDTDGERTYS